MIYKNIFKAYFISRPNRFIANINIDGKEEKCHVKNTGRLGELLINGAVCYVEKSDNPDRKTKYDLIAIENNSQIINIDSQAPNKIVYEWLLSEKNGIIKDIIKIKPECKYKNSRFDFYIETKKDKIFMEVKGVTLKKNDVALFPDAPTERGVKHLYELCECIKDGYKAYVFFVIKMKGISHFTPNIKTHPEFYVALKNASENNVGILCYDCIITENSLNIDKKINCKL